jgi:hypothetical protein
MPKRRPNSCFGRNELEELANFLQESHGEPNGIKIGLASRSEDLLERLREHGLGEFAASGSLSASPNDFFVLLNWKRIHVSPKGNRSMRLTLEAMALRDGISERIFGTIVWRKSIPAPKFHLSSVIRLDPLKRGIVGTIEHELVKKEGGALAFQLRFAPPLMKGEYISYGYYFWIPKHYSMTREEAEQRYKDRWVREGLAVRDPSDLVGITVDLPPRYRVQRAILERNPILLNPDGPNIPGTVASRVTQVGRLLTSTVHKPESGRYFLSWVPPSKKQKREYSGI